MACTDLGANGVNVRLLDLPSCRGLWPRPTPLVEGTGWAPDSPALPDFLISEEKPHLQVIL